MSLAEKRLEDTKNVITSARAKIWPLGLGLLLMLLSAIVPQYEVVNRFAEVREGKSFIKEKIEASHELDARGIRPSQRKRLRLNHFRNTLNSEIAQRKADEVKDVPFEPFGVKFSVPFEFAPFIWICLCMVMMFVMVTARQRGLNLLTNALAVSQDASPEKSSAHLLATPPVWFAPVSLSRGMDSIGKAEVLRALGWSSWHNRIFAALTGMFLFATLLTQIWVAYIGHQTFLARCAFEQAFELWPARADLETHKCSLSWLETLSVVGEVAVVGLSIIIVAAWVLPVAVRPLEKPPQSFLLFGRRRALEVLGATLIIGATAVYAGGPPAWASVRKKTHEERRARYCKGSLRYTPRRKPKSRVSGLTPGFYVNKKSGVIHAVERYRDCPTIESKVVAVRTAVPEGFCIKVAKTLVASPNSSSTVSFIRGLPDKRAPSDLGRLSIVGLKQYLDESRREERRLRPTWPSTLIETSALKLWSDGDRRGAASFLITVLTHDLGPRGRGLKPNIRLLDLAAGMACREGLDSELGKISRLARENIRRHKGLPERAAKWDPNAAAAVGSEGGASRSRTQAKGGTVDLALVEEDARAPLTREKVQLLRARWRAKWTSTNTVEWHFPGSGGDCQRFEL